MEDNFLAWPAINKGLQSAELFNPALSGKMCATEGSFDLRLTYGRADLQLLDIYGTLLSGAKSDGLLGNASERQTPLFSSKKWLKRIRMLIRNTQVALESTIYALASKVEALALGKALTLLFTKQVPCQPQSR